jgi:6-pyruvoyltetrahydropterin/6-carboxytetrahydropterin synthase
MRLRLTRERAFEASHRYWLDDLTAEENRRLFGRCVSPHGHGHNYRVRARVVGRLDERTGMVVNVKELDDALAEVVAPLDHRFLNHEWPPLAGRQPTTEVLAALLRDGLAERVRGWPARVENVRLYETEELWADAEETTMVTLTRTYTFSAAHRLHEPGLSDEENRALFGKCNREHGHGHDYRLEVTVGGDVDPRTGMVLNLAGLDASVREAVLDRWDHRHLNLETAEFLALNPTSENVVRVAWELLAPRVGPAKLTKLVLWETPRSAFEYRGEA